uniref:Putative secreted protein n=2 Tax=Amblyomma triste TaxID=251400 RepID=A0A023G0B1_AMBTT
MHATTQSLRRVLSPAIANMRCAIFAFVSLCVAGLAFAQGGRYGYGPPTRPVSGGLGANNRLGGGWGGNQRPISGGLGENNRLGTGGGRYPGRRVVIG